MPFVDYEDGTRSFVLCDEDKKLGLKFFESAQRLWGIFTKEEMTMIRKEFKTYEFVQRIKECW